MKDHPDCVPNPPSARPACRGPHVLIVGGGASGVLAAAHLLRAAPSAHVTVVEPNDRLGAGLAYATADRTHLLNVCAGRMSALADDPGHFLGWLARQGQDDDAGRFVPRRVYGAYLADLLTPWRTTRQPRVRHIRSVCVDLAAGPQGITATLADGSTLCADHAILATGHTLPQAVAQVDPPAPSATAEATPQGERVLILGTGLTMVDHVLSLLDQGFCGQITAVSRRGLLPMAHRPATALPLAAGDIPIGLPVSRLCRWLRDLARLAEHRGGTWRDAMEALRPQTQRIWRNMSEAERARFLRHGQRWWDIHRHRMPPSSELRLWAALDSGQLGIVRAEVVSVGELAGGVTALIRPFGGSELEVLRADRVLDARGLRWNPSLSPLLAQLLAQGTIRVGPLGLGLDLSAESAVIGADGRSSDRIWSIGPPARAAFWEITAIPDIREQAARLAAHLAGTVTTDARLPGRSSG